MWRTVPTEPGGCLFLSEEPGSARLPTRRAAEEPVPKTTRAFGSVEAPDLIGMTTRDARRTARFAEVPLVVEHEPVASGSRGRVFRQQPAPGAPLRPGEVVTASVGIRPDVAVPDVRGWDELDTLATLRASGLEPSRKIERRSRSVPPGQVIRTRPRAGTLVPVGTRIAYAVATTPRPERVSGERGSRRARALRMSDGSLLTTPRER